MNYQNDMDKSELDSKFVTFGSALLIVLNVLTFILGLGIAATATYVWTNSSTLLGIQFSENFLIVAMVLGLVIFFVSFLGIYGTFRRSKIALIIYLLAVFVVLALSITGAVLLAQLLVVLNSPNGQEKTETSKSLTDLILSFYLTCCKENAQICDPLALPATPGFCKAVSDTCPNPDPTISDACFNSKRTTGIGQEVCTILFSANIVGPLQDNLCGSGDPIEFESQVVAFLDLNARSIYIIIGVACGVELIAAVFAGMIIIRHSPSKSEILVARAAETVEAEFINPMISNSVRDDDQQFRRIDSVRSNASRPLSPRASMERNRPLSVTSRASSTNADGHVSRVISVDIGNGARMSIDAASGIQVARPVEEDEDVNDQSSYL